MSGHIINEITLSELSEEEVLEQEQYMDADEIKRLRALQHKMVRDEKRLLQLEERERKRKEREEERKRQEQERLREECEGLLNTYQNTQQQFEQAIVARDGLQEKLSGLKLPDAPILPEAPELTDAELSEQHVTTIQKALQLLQKKTRDYQHAVDEALMEYHRHQAERDSVDEIEAWSSKFSTRAIRTAADVISTLERPSLFVTDKQRQIRLNSLRSKAKANIEKYLHETGNDDNSVLPDEIIMTLDDVLNASSEAKAQHALALLGKKLREHSTEQLRIEAAEKQKILLKEQRSKTRLLAETTVHTLEDMGYTVSGIEDTVFARNGELYAMLPDYPDHAMRFSFDPGSSHFSSAPVRIREEEQVIGEADAREMQKEDKEFDAHWCGNTHLDAKARLQKRGIPIRYNRNHEAGELELEQVDAQVLSESLQQERQTSRKELQLREKNNE